MIYALRLAVRGLRRTPGLTAVLFVTLAVATGMWTAALVHNLRTYAGPPPLTPALHQVELPHSDTVRQAWTPSNAESDATDSTTWLYRTRVSYPEYQLLAGSAIAPRQTGTVRTRLVVWASGAQGEAAGASARVGRFVGADFFPLFDIPLAHGRPFTREEDAAGEAVVVLGHRLSRALFGRRDPVGKSVFIEGRPFRIVGTVKGDQPFRPAWDIAAMGAGQDTLYLPWSWWQRLRTPPDAFLYQSAVGPSFEELLRSDTVFVTFWIELPTARHRETYRRYLDQRLGGAPGAYILRSYAEWAAAFPTPESTTSFVQILTAFFLLGAGFTMSRLQLAKGLIWHRDLGILRALGANRLALTRVQLLEGALIGIPAALVGVALAVPYNVLFNRLSAGGDVPLRLDGSAVVFGAAPAVAVGILSCLYPTYRVLRGRPAAALERG